MRLKVLGSSSKGNGYLIISEDSVIVIDCGVPLIEVKKAIGFNISLITAVLMTHSHGDHNKYVKQYLDAGIKVYAHPETIAESKVKSHKWVPVELKKIIEVGEYKVMPFELKHDVMCVGFLFRHTTDNTFCFITDTLYSPYVFDGLTNIIIECNYSEAIINSRNIPLFLKNRILRSHTSLETCKKFLSANDLSKVNNIILVHLSDGNSHAKEFKKEIEQLTGKTVHIADVGMDVHFGITPF